VIDCPGSHTRLSQVAHSLADTLVTPLNDSFIDFDLLAHIDSEGVEIKGPSVYSGLTLLDLKDVGVKQLNVSNIAARQELRDLIKSLNLLGVTVDF